MIRKHIKGSIHTYRVSYKTLLFPKMFFSFGILALTAIVNIGINAKPPSRIINGEGVDIMEAPFTVMIYAADSLQSLEGLLCGGTIIGKRHILTAAHCLADPVSEGVYKYDYEWLRILMGVNGHQCGLRAYEVLTAYVHPAYTGNVLDTVNDRADIAVLKLKERIIYGPRQRRIELANEPPNNYAHGLIYGWGDTEPDRPIPSSTLQKAVQRVYDYNTCRTLDPSFGYVKDELCIKSHSGLSFCQGDSGGPLIVNGKVAGVISNAYDCGSMEPGAVSNVAHYKSWIEDAIRGIAPCRTLPFMTGSSPDVYEESNVIE